MRWFLLFAALLSLSFSAVSAAAQTPAPRINPLTGKPYSAAGQAEYERKQREAEEQSRMAEEAAAQDNKAFEELRARNAEQIRQFDEAIETWKDTTPPPPGTVETFVSTSYDNETALGERAEITFYNKYDVPTHKVQFGPDGKPTGPVTLTQQGKVWETIGPRIPPGGGVETSYGEDFEGNRIITRARIFTAGGKSIGDYKFNFDGVPWWGETKDPETGLVNGGFMDERLKPPEATLGGPLPFPSQIRLITGVCEPCRALMEKHNSLALDINEIIIEMKSLSQEHQRAWPPAQRPIRARHAVLSARLAELMPQMEALQAEVIECDKRCRPAAQEPPPTVAALPGQPLLRPPAGIGARPTAPEKTYRPGLDAFPANDADLRAITDAAQRYLAAAELCETMLCPVCDCDEAKASAQALADMEAYLEAMLPYLRAANEDHMERFLNTARNNITTGEQVERTIWAVGVHTYLQNFGSSLLDVASIAGWLRDIVTAERGLDELSPVEMLDQLNSAYEALKDLESLTATIAEAQTGRPQDTPVADLVELAAGADKAFINDATSYITDLKDIVTNAVEHGRDWRAALKAGAGPALGQIVGRILKTYSAAVLEERKGVLDDLLNNAAVGDLQQAREFQELLRVRRRREAAEDALAAVRAARRRYMACVHEACGAFSLTRANIPTFRDDVPGREAKLSWGRALPWFNRAIDETLPLMKPVVFRSECPEETAEPPRTQPPPQSEPLDDGPDLSRPSFEWVSELVIPKQFCSEYARNDYIVQVYNPAIQAALRDAALAQNHLAMLNALFTQHMRTNSPYWGQVRAERDAYDLIAQAATARAEALRGRYADVIAVPVVPCDDQPLPLTPSPSTPPPLADPPPPPFTPPTPPTSAPFQPVYGGPEFPYFDPIEPRAKYCSRAEVEADLARMRARLTQMRDLLDELEVLAASSLANRQGEPADLARADRNRLADFYNTLPDDMPQAEKEARGRIFLAFEGTAVRLFDRYEAQIANLEKSINQLEDILARGQYDCPSGTVSTPKEPCPPKQGRDPIVVGPNSRVGSGAQLRSKVGGMALGALAGALGAGGGGGGGGGSDGPQLWTCKIKDSEYTVFNDPVTGVSLGVAAKTVKGGKMVLFSKIMKSPDKGTFQTAFLERPSTGQTIAPSDVGPCDLWGEWKLTVSWTRSTYVDGQLVSQESGGWSEGGLFRIPGMLSKVDAPDGLWKRMGFSNASNGAREMGAIFDVQPAGEPLTLVVHVTRPKGDPVTTVPFVLTLTQGADGKIGFTEAEEEPCPEETATSVSRSGPTAAAGEATPAARPPCERLPEAQAELREAEQELAAMEAPGYDEEDLDFKISELKADIQGLKAEIDRLAAACPRPPRPPSSAGGESADGELSGALFGPTEPPATQTPGEPVNSAEPARPPCERLPEAQADLREAELELEVLESPGYDEEDLDFKISELKAEVRALKSEIEQLEVTCLKLVRRQPEEYPSTPVPASPGDPCLERRLIEERIRALLKAAERNASFGFVDELEDQAAIKQVTQLRERLAGLPTDCPAPPAPPSEVMPTPTAGPGALSAPGAIMATPAPTGPATAPAAPGPGAGAGSGPRKPTSAANDDLFLPKPEVTYFRPKGSDGPRFANYRQIADALGARKPCTREEAQRLLEEVSGALAAQGEAIDDLTVYAGASQAESSGAGGAPGDLYGPDRPTGRTTSTEDGRESTRYAFEAEAVRVRRAAGDEGEKAFRDMDSVQSELRRLKRSLEISIETDDFDDCPADPPPAPPAPPPPVEVMPTPTAGPGDLPGLAPGAVTPPAGSGATTTRPPLPPTMPPWGPGPKPYDPRSDPEFGKLHTAGLLRLVDGLEKMRAEDIGQRRELDRARCEGPKAWEEKRTVYLKRLRVRLDIMERIVGLGRDKAAIESAATGEVVRLGGEIAEVEAMSPPAEPQSCPVTPVPEEEESILDEIEEVLVPA